MKKTLLIIIVSLFVVGSMPSCKGPHCSTYTSSQTTGKLSKSVKKRDKAKKKQRRKSGGKMKTGKPLF